MLWIAGDAIRPFILHAYGGLYLDMDVECFRSPEPLMAGFDLIFQSEFQEANDINNAVMAGVPGHPFWMQVDLTRFQSPTTLPLLFSMASQVPLCGMCLTTV